MPNGWYCYIENTGTGVFTLQSSANIDGVNQAITLQPNTGVLVVSDGIRYWTERGTGASPILKHGGSLNSSQAVLNLVGVLA